MLQYSETKEHLYHLKFQKASGSHKPAPSPLPGTATETRALKAQRWTIPLVTHRLTRQESHWEMAEIRTPQSQPESKAALEALY